MLKGEILGDQVPRHRRNWFALVYRSSFVCALLLSFSLIYMYITSFAHSNSYKDTPPAPPNPWIVIDSSFTLQSSGNHLFASARCDEGPDCPVLADQPSASPAPNSYEVFDEMASNGLVAFKSHENGQFLSVKKDQNGTPVEADGKDPSGWEQFTKETDPSTNLTTLKSQVTQGLLTVDPGNNNTLEAPPPPPGNVFTAITAWQQFTTS